MQIERPSYRIRPLRQDDARALFANYKGCSSSAKYLSSPCHGNVRQTEGVIARALLAYQQATPKVLPLAIALPSDDQVIGLLTFVLHDDYAELHFGISQRYRGQGIVLAACADALLWLQQRGVGEVRTHPHHAHAASIHILQKLGFRRVGTIEQYALFPQISSQAQDCADMRLRFGDSLASV
ncbi:GNAT family N-acetyltransferase [Ferrimonas senticii]|uniref:GNAT family N-acetyltransferase n=1 Tax=Ferrimonas senticii TaxID=394566 RepID=UPI0004867713|nr:GNAT family protein [Ferrimonas senticii]